MAPEFAPLIEAVYGKVMDALPDIQAGIYEAVLTAIDEEGCGTVMCQAVLMLDETTLKR